MRRPGSHEFILGNRAVTIALLCAGFYELYAAAALNASWVYPAGFLVLGYRAAKARARVVEYRQWARAWDAASGAAPEGQTAASSAPRRRAGRAFMLTLVWAFMGGWLKLFADESARNPNYGWMTMGFGALTLWGAGSVLVSALRSLGRSASPSAAARSRATREHIVSVCLPVPRSSSAPEDLFAALPAYVQELLARSAAAASGNDHPRAPSPPT